MSHRRNQRTRRSIRVVVSAVLAASSSVAASPVAAVEANGIEIVYPNGGEVVSRLTTIRWRFDDHTGVSPDDTVTISFTPNAGGSFIILATGVPITALSHPWDTATAPDSNRFKIRIRVERHPGQTDHSDGTFIVDNTPPSITTGTLTDPNGGEYLAGGAVVEITWRASDVTDSNLGARPISLDYTTDGAAFTPIASGESNDGSFTWTVPGIDSNTVRVRLTVTDLAGNTASDLSDGDVVVDSTAPSVDPATITFPNGGEALAAGSTRTITWDPALVSDANLGPTPISLGYTTDGAAFTPIASGESNDGSFTWIVPGIDSSTVRVRLTVTDLAGHTASDLSDAAFTIDATAPAVSVLSPNGGEVFPGGGMVEIRWSTSAGDLGPAPIEIHVTIGDDLFPVAAGEADDGGFEWTAPRVDADRVRVRVTAIDRAGNAGSDVSDAPFTLDATAPTVSVAGPAGGERIRGGQVMPITWDAADATFGSAPIDLLFSTDGGATWSPIALGEEDDGRFDWTVPALDAADVRVRVRAADRAGHVTERDSAPFLVDSTPPAVSIAAVAGDDLVNLAESSAAEVTGTAGDALTGVASVLISATDGTATAGPGEAILDGGSFTAVLDTSSLADGPVTVSVRATDGVGNVREATREVTLDRSAPEVSLEAAPRDPTNQSTARFEFGSSDRTARFACSLDGAPLEPCASPADHAGLGEGTHRFSVRVSDPAGNVGPAASFAWVVDLTPPAVTIDAHPSDPSTDTTATFAFNVAPDSAEVACSLDETDFSPCTSPVSYPGLEEGGHTFRVRATDAAGNVGAAAFAWEVDTGSPSVQVDSAPPEVTNATTATFAFHSSDRGARFTCSLDGAGEPCVSPVTYSDLVEGSHTFSVVATDGAGNTGPEATFAWTVDLTAPSVTVTAAPEDPTNETTAAFAFAASEPASLSCRLDGAEPADCSGGRVSYGGLPDGRHVFEVRATDRAGNEGPAAALEWTVDTRAPTLSLEEAPPPYAATGSASFAFRADEPVAFRCSLDGEPATACDDGTTSYAGLPDGPHSFAIRATDRAGNTGAVVTHSWVVDTAAPAMRSDTLLAPNGGEVVSGGDVVEVRWRPSDVTDRNLPPDPISVWLSIDGGSSFVLVASGEQNDGSFSWSVPLLDTNRAVLRITVTDRAGNASSDDSDEPFLVDSSPPLVSLDGPIAGDDAVGAAEASHVSISGSAADQGSGLASVHVSATDGTSVVGPVEAVPAEGRFSATLDVSSLAEGTIVFEVDATDRTGHTRSEARPATLDLRPPSLAADGPIAGDGVVNRAESTEVTLTGSAADGLTGVASVRVSASDGTNVAGPVEAALEAGRWSAVVDSSRLADGRITFHVVAEDGAGNPAEAIVEAELDTRAPAIDITGGPEAVTDSTSATFSFSSEPGATFRCRLDGGAEAPCGSPASYDEIVEGEHVFEVRATDAAGNPSEPASFRWQVDTTPPTVAITAHPPAVTNATDAAFRFDTPSEDAVGFACSLDRAAFEACTSPAAYSGLGEGRHVFQVRAADAAGNVGPAETIDWTVDLTPPSATIVTRPPSVSGSPEAVFEFTASEDGAAFACRLDDGRLDPCASPAVYSGLADGPHSFEVRATDAAGNAGPGARVSWTVDTVPPTVVLTSSPPDAASSTEARFTFWADEKGVTIECRLDGGAASDCSSGEAVYADLAEGVHTFEVRARDAAGNLGPASGFTWTVDLSPPGVTITSGPLSPTGSTTAVFEFSSPEGGVSFECSLDGAAFQPCASPTSLTGLSEGEHTFRVRAVDPAGNASTDAFTWVVDVTAPGVTITAAPPPFTPAAEATFEFSSPEGGVSFECSLDGAAFQPCASPTSLTGLSEGEHTFRVRGVDAAGNAGEAASFVWTVDATAPAVTITEGPPPLTNSREATFEFSSPEDGVSFECSLDGAAFQPCASPTSLTGLSEGEHTFRVRGVDAAGNVSTATFTWVVDLTAPEARITSATAPLTTETAAVFEFSSPEDGVSFECSLDGAAFQPCASPTRLTGLSDGTHRFRVRVTDEAGNVTEVSFTWTVDTTLPTVTIETHPNSHTSATSAVFAFRSSEEGSTFECSLDGASFTPCKSPVGYAGLAEGSHAFLVRATDAVGNVGEAASFTWAIEGAPTVTILSGPSRLSNSRLAAFEFVGSRQGLTFECSLDGAPFAPCESPATYSDLADGAHAFEVLAVEPGVGGGPAERFDWTVEATPPVVTFTGAPPRFTPATDASFRFEVSEAVEVLECRLDDAAFAPCAGSAAYGGLSEGEHQFEVRATDAADNVGTAAHVWTVDTLAPQLVVSVGPSQCGGGSWCSASRAVVTVAASDEGSGLAADPSGEREVEEEGATTLAFTAEDRAGNAATAEATVRIDRTPPKVTIESPANGAIILQPTAGRLHIAGTARDLPEEAKSGVRNVYVSVCPDLLPLGQCIAGKVPTRDDEWGYTVPETLLPGRYVILAGAEDGAQNGPPGTWVGIRVIVV